MASVASLDEDGGQAVTDKVCVQAAIGVLGDGGVIEGQVHHAVLALLHDTNQLTTRDQVTEAVSGLDAIVFLDSRDLHVGQNSLLSLLRKTAELRGEGAGAGQRNDLGLFITMLKNRESVSVAKSSRY